MKSYIIQVYYIFLARIREFYRDKSSWYWNLLFPFFILGAFYLLFNNDYRQNMQVGVVGELSTIEMESQKFFKLKNIQFLSIEKSEGQQKVSNHRLDMLVELGPVNKYWVNSTNTNGYFLEQIIRHNIHGSIQKQTISSREVRYLDWVFPGIIALNIMFSCLWGVGWVIVKYRDDGYLKRLHATPLTASRFLLGHLLSRVIIVSLVTGFIFIVGSWIINFEMQGSYLDLSVCYFIGVVSLSSIGLLVSSRTTSKEFTDGALNLFSWPMFVFSGMWFSLDGFSPIVRALSYSLPMTHLIESTRAVMLEGATLSDVWFNISSLLLFSLIVFVLVSILFKWNKK